MNVENYFEEILKETSNQDSSNAELDGTGSWVEIDRID
jgi:hypothetical protein